MEDLKCVKAYLVDKNNICKRTGMKEDPFKVAEEMRSAMKGGVRRFRKSGKQVASFFSRLTQNDKKCDSNDDYNAAAKEQILTDLKLVITAIIGSVKTPRRCRKKTEIIKNKSLHRLGVDCSDIIQLPVCFS